MKNLEKASLLESSDCIVSRCLLVRCEGVLDGQAVVKIHSGKVLTQCLWAKLFRFFLHTLFTESHQSSHGFYSDSSRDAGIGQHALLGQISSGHLHQGKWSCCVLQIPTPQQLFLVCVASSSCRLFWRTAVEKISMSVPSGAVPSSLPGCFVRSCKLGNSVSTTYYSSFPSWKLLEVAYRLTNTHKHFYFISLLPCKGGGGWSRSVSVPVIIPVSKYSKILVCALWFSLKTDTSRRLQLPEASAGCSIKKKTTLEAEKLQTWEKLSSSDSLKTAFWDN